jgi:hypothetical protein
MKERLMMTHHESSGATLEGLKESLRRLGNLLEVTADGISALSEYQKDIIDEFTISNGFLEELLIEYYWSNFSNQEVPEEDRVATVLAEFVSSEKITVGHAMDLFDQFMAATFLRASSWFAAQPTGADFMKETVEKIPLFYQRSLDLMIVLETESGILIIQEQAD